jgi:hypothetical protein
MLDISKLLITEVYCIMITEPERSINIQPADIMKMLSLTEEQYDLVNKSWRLLFDLLCYMKDGTQITSSLVVWTKVGEDKFIASMGEKSVSLDINPETDVDVIYQELADAISASNNIRLPI